ncbi:hypothetical protein ACJIZ3_022682 [Penstemon smallii]|uniref:Protein kinase domain-containing protein n=1 Tax=Penstemon smallii TaxID=265156 RepID=A0ABD3TN90_9LAMI
MHLDIVWFCGLIIIILFCFLETSYANLCSPSSCGEIRNISNPFRLRDDPNHCGDSSYELTCENNATTSIYLNSHKYHVKAINYDNYTIRLVDVAIKSNDSCSFPRFSLYGINFIHDNRPYSIYSYEVNSSEITIKAYYFYELPISHSLEEPRTLKNNTYVKVGHLKASDVGDNCSIDLTVMTSWPFNIKLDYNTSISLSEIHVSLQYGFELSWFSSRCPDYCKVFKKHCFIYSNRPTCGVKLLNIAAKILIGIPFLIWIFIYKFRTRHTSMFDVIESFLRNQNNLTPIRYSYSDIKKITKGFQEKLGQGGYGSVYKGKLRSGSAVAVKLLTKPKANGQDFINEVATIGRIHHVNVVRLVGYCAERSKRALVYDFMPNGSLDKYIFNKESSNPLNWEKKYEIAVGVARGIEYLHRGCDIQILHFDIKPHNILLDDKFTPKVSDFGLAKFYSTDKDHVTLTVARGTIGYVAPELINRSIGDVSYKADVYSFGMLLMEMVGLKRDMAENSDNSSQYFPQWIYRHLDKGKDIELGNIDDDDDDARKIKRKMTIVALWCIRMSPCERPPMNRVVEMLESEVENIQIPPEPSQSALVPVAQNHEDQSWGTYSTDSISLLHNQ